MHLSRLLSYPAVGPLIPAGAATAKGVSMAAGFTRMDWVRVRGADALWRVESIETAADGTELVTCRPADVYHGGAARTFAADELEAVPDPYGQRRRRRR